jgi:hypothetical protein
MAMAYCDNYIVGIVKKDFNIEFGLHFIVFKYCNQDDVEGIQKEFRTIVIDHNNHITSNN